MVVVEGGGGDEIGVSSLNYQLFYLLGVDSRGILTILFAPIIPSQCSVLERCDETQFARYSLEEKKRKKILKNFEFFFFFGCSH